MEIITPSTRILSIGGYIRFQGVVTVAAANWWDPNNEGLCVWAAYAPKGAASLAASYTDLSGNSHDAGVGAAPDWDGTNGWKFNGSSHYLTTAFVAASDQSQSIIIRYSNCVTDGGFVAGVSCGYKKQFGYQGYPGFSLALWHNGANYMKQSFSCAAGIAAIAGNGAYWNGSSAGSIPAWSGSCGSVSCIGAQGPSGGNYSAVYVQALAIYDCTLTGDQVAAITAAMQAL